MTATLINALLVARTRAKLTQAQVARRMGTSQSAVARLESGRSPSLASLRKYAAATGSRVEITLAPAKIKSAPAKSKRRAARQI